MYKTGPNTTCLKKYKQNHENTYNNTIFCIAPLLLTADTSPDEIQVPGNTLEEIRQHTAEKWPDDFSMHKYEIEQQTSAYKGLFA